jgi:hypothetical protein
MLKSNAVVKQQCILVKKSVAPKNASKSCIKTVLKIKTDAESDIESDINDGSDVESDIESLDESDTESEVSSSSESTDTTVSVNSEKDSIESETDTTLIHKKCTTKKTIIKKPQKNKGDIPLSKELILIKSKNYLDCITELLEEEYIPLPNLSFILPTSS